MSRLDELPPVEHAWASTEGTKDLMPPSSSRLHAIVSHPDVLTELPEPIRLASGAMSQHFIDGKHAVDDPEDLQFVGEAMLASAREVGVEFDAVGGLVLGAVPFTFAVARAADRKWFLIRKEPKVHGTRKLVEGAHLKEGDRVMLVDDVVTTGGSIRIAYNEVRAIGADVVFATTLVDRGDQSSEFFRGVGVPYKPLVTYHDLDIPPVRYGHQEAARATR